MNCMSLCKHVQAESALSSAINAAPMETGKLGAKTAEFVTGCAILEWRTGHV